MLVYSFYRPRKEGKLREPQRERRSRRYSTLDEAGDEPGTFGLGGRDLTNAPTPPLYMTAQRAKYIHSSTRLQGLGMLLLITACLCVGSIANIKEQATCSWL